MIKYKKKNKKIELHDNHGHKNSEKDEYYIEIMKIIIMKIIIMEKEKINKDTNKYSHVHDHKPNENNEKNNHVNNLQDPEITSLLITTSTPLQI